MLPTTCTLSSCRHRNCGVCAVCAQQDEDVHCHVSSHVPSFFRLPTSLTSTSPAAYATHFLDGRTCQHRSLLSPCAVCLPLLSSPLEDRLAMKRPKTRLAANHAAHPSLGCQNSHHAAAFSLTVRTTCEMPNLFLSCPALIPPQSPCRRRRTRSMAIEIILWTLQVAFFTVQVLGHHSVHGHTSKRK